MGDNRARAGQQAEPKQGRTLLVLGAKPEPRLPPLEAFQDLACANASGHGAARQGLPPPAFTVMTALLTDGSDAGRQRIAALAGLRTGELVYYPRPQKEGSPWRRLLHRIKTRRLRHKVLVRALAGVGYRYDRLVLRPNAHYQALICRLCDDDPAIAAQLARKQASSGVVAAAIGLADGRWSRVILAGFSFELTQSFGTDANIGLRGQTRSLHRDTDVMVLAALARGHDLVTTEPIVHEAVGLAYA